MKLRSLCCLALLLGAGGGLGQSVNITSTNRVVAVSLTAASPLATTSSYAETNSSSAALLLAGGQIDWQEIDGWTPPSTRGSASQGALFTSTQLSLSVDLVTEVGGDPYGVRLPPPSSGEAYASSLFEVVFSVAEPTGYRYAFDFAINATLANADLRLTSVNGVNLQLFRTSIVPEDGPILLLPGDQYTLAFNYSCAATGDKFGGSSSTLLFEFLPEPVPEPCAGALLMLGAVLLSSCRRKRSYPVG